MRTVAFSKYSSYQTLIGSQSNIASFKAGPHDYVLSFPANCSNPHQKMPFYPIHLGLDTQVYRYRALVMIYILAVCI